MTTDRIFNVCSWLFVINLFCLPVWLVVNAFVTVPVKNGEFLFWGWVFFAILLFSLMSIRSEAPR